MITRSDIKRPPEPPPPSCSISSPPVFGKVEDTTILTLTELDVFDCVRPAKVYDILAEELTVVVDFAVLFTRVTIVIVTLSPGLSEGMLTVKVRVDVLLV